MFQRSEMTDNRRHSACGKTDACINLVLVVRIRSGSWTVTHFVVRDGKPSGSISLSGN